MEKKEREKKRNGQNKILQPGIRRSSTRRKSISSKQQQQQ
jgi:hypothetical protein